MFRHLDVGILVMVKLVRPLVIFLLLYLASCGVLYFGLPRLMAWHLAHCASGASVVCSASSAFLTYWWLALLPTLFVVTLLINRATAKRHAA